MRLLIRYIESRGTNQHVFDGKSATIGRGTNQDIQISDSRLPLNHSSISVSSGKLVIAAQGSNRLTVNDQPSKRAELVPGDVVSILGHNLQVLEGEDGTEYVIQIEVEAEKLEALRDRFTTRIKELGVPERKVSWVLFIAIIAIGLVIPAAGLFVGMDTLRESPLPDDSIWLSGELHQTHAFMGDDCTYCHKEAFVQTRDEDCLPCHLTVNHHFDTEKFGSNYKVDDECADCHKEHSVTDGITRTSQSGCTVCHADLAAAGYASDRLRPVTDFLNDHPRFKLTMEVYEADDEWHKVRVDNWQEDLQEESNLIFPHDVHLVEEGIKGADETVVMVCRDCHEPEKGGFNMKAVTMEKHCADCHELTFDPSTPNRVVPHGSPPDLMRTLREYYAYQFLNRDRPKTTATTTERVTMQLPQTRAVRRPGRAPRPTTSITDLIIESSVDKSEPLTVQAARFIDARVEDAAENLFEKQTCTICHDIGRSDDREVPWLVKPVHLSVNWMPLADFSHDSHKNMTCDGCHEAENSPEATDVLMPNIGSCRACHGGQDATNLLQSSCVSCHRFHLDSEAPMGTLIAKDNSEGEQ